MYNQEKALKRIVDYSRKNFRAETELEKQEQLSKPWMSLHQQMHTNLPNEITGGYYNADEDSHPIISTLIGILVALALTAILADAIWGAEVVTYWLAGLIS